MTSKKNVQFQHPLSPLFLSVRMGQNKARHSSAPGRGNLSYQPPPLHPHPLFLQKIGMLKRKPKCCPKPSFLQNQTPVCLEHLQQNHTPVWNTYSRIRHQSGTLIAEPDTCLEHCLDSNNTYTNYCCGHPISVGPLPLPNPYCNHPLPSKFIPFFTLPPPPIYWMS